MSEGAKESLVKRFSGDGADPQKEYKRWKRWSRAYLTVQWAKGTPEAAMGSLLFTLLDGSALRAFDATNMDDLEVEGGQDVVYQVLDDRYPEESSHDRLGEILDAIFDLKVERGESTAVYTGKARAAFRSYNENDISAALRTTFPDHLYAGRQNNVNAVDGDYDQVETFSEEEQQVLLAEEGDPEELGNEPIEEQDAVDILMTWKQTRTNINKEKIARGLNGQRDMKKLEARVRCFKCKQVGHFSRNCPRRGGKGAAGPPSSSSGTTKVSYVMMVQDEKMESGDDETAVHEVVSIWNGRPKDFWQSHGKKVIRHHVLPRTQMFNARWTGCPVRYERLKDKRTTCMQFMSGEQKVVEDDTTFHMEESKKRTAEEWIGKTVFYMKDDEDSPPEDRDMNEIVQAFVAATTDQPPWGSMEEEMEPGSSDEEPETTHCQLLHPAGWGVVDTGCGRGVIGENTLRRHEHQLRKFNMEITELEPKPHRFRYGNGSMDVSYRRVQIPIMVSGRELRMRVHVVPGEVPLLISKRFLKGLGSQMDLQNNKIHFAKAGITANLVEREDNSYQLDLLDGGEVVKVKSPEVDVLVSQVEDGGQKEEEMSIDGAALGSVEDAPQDGTLDYSGEETEEETDVRCVFKARERKELMTQLQEVLRVKDDERHSIVEVFSPGRFAEVAQDFGFESLGAYDLSLDWDWNKVIHRRRLEERLALSPPDILVMTPPCGPLSRLQQCTPEEKRRDPEAFRKEIENAKAMIRWCLKLAEKQLAMGLHYLFESSQTSAAWSMEEMKKFQEWWQHPCCDVAACSVGLKDKESDKRFGKKWRFMTSSSAVATMLEPLVCSRDHEHQVVEGSSGGVMRSIQTQIYPKRLIRKILGGFRMHGVVEDHCCAISQETVQVTGPLKGEGRRRVETAIRKMHVNLGHASTDDLHRILRHHGASSEVLELVKAFKCDVCEAHKAPKAVKDSAPPRDLAPLRYIGLDVKWLPTWKKDYKIKALNIVCRASGLQQVYPFRENEQECSELIARLYRHWTRSFGRPKFCKFDASRCNLGQPFLDALERDGTTAIDIPGEAHEQLGDVEAQGRHYEGMLTKVIHEMSPTNYLEWVECVDATVEARNMLMKRNGYSSFQLVFGRDPEFPGDDILGEKPNEIANGAILEDAIAEYTFRARSIARQQVLEALDHKAARIALNSRPRPQREFRPGDEVAVWRRGRGIKKSTARWRGPGIVAGLAGGNVWVSMPGAFIKCSPEQLRLRTNEEREADRFLVRDLRAAAAALYPEVGFSGRNQKCFVDITQADRPPGDLLTPGMVHMPEEPSVAEPAANVPIPHVEGNESNQGSEHGSRRGSDSTSNPRPPSSFRESISSMDRSTQQQLGPVSRTIGWAHDKQSSCRYGGPSWKQSKLDPCTFFLWDGPVLAGVMGVHVDDVVIGGRGQVFDKKLQQLRSTFPFRKWQEGQGTFCGSFLQQNPETGGISVSQRDFIDKMQKPKLRTKDPASMEVNDEEVTSLKSCLGAALWLARETRPDLSVQVSQGQQLMPRPTLGDAKTVGNVVRRAKQYQELEWRILPIPIKRLRLCLHTDAAFGNAKGKGTQAGYIVGVTDELLQQGKEAVWSPAAWRSYRLKRVVGSTFAGESQALMDGLGHAEWIGCHLAEGIYSDFSLQERGNFLKFFEVQAIVDCKSVYDHLQQYASPGSVSDKRGFKDEEIRALFECMVSSFAKSGQEYDTHMSQTRAMCKVKIPAEMVNSKEMKGETKLITYSYCRSTNMVTVSAAVVLVDKAEAMLAKVLQAYGQMLHENEIAPLPAGAQQWGKAFQMVKEQGATSFYLRGLENEATGSLTTTSAEMQTHLPKDEEFSAAVADLCQDGARRLHNFPLWKQRFLQFLLQEYGADPDHVMALSGIPQQFKMNTFEEEDWDVGAIADVCPKAKAKPEPSLNGYRY
eukprot:symbB.v1.2.034744.t1/scaffold4544.1/size38254/1